MHSDGSVWCGGEAGRLMRVRPDGRVETVAHDPTAHTLCHPTNIAFRGDTAFTADLGRWHITALDVVTR